MVSTFVLMEYLCFVSIEYLCSTFTIERPLCWFVRIRDVVEDVFEFLRPVRLVWRS